MDIPISDLLDGLQEVDLEMLPEIRVPVDRIEELTMKKLHKYERNRGRGLSFVTRILVAAIIITTLAIPVMAAGGFTLKDWLTAPESETLPRDEAFGDSVPSASAAEALIASNYYLNTQTENATPTGLTFVCLERGDYEVKGTLSTSDGYWVDKWDGSRYVALEGRREGTTRIPVENDGRYSWEIDWTEVYGSLPAGGYRIGKTFTLTMPDGEAYDFPVTVFFRIFTEEMAPYVTQAKTAMDALTGRHSVHLMETQYDTRDNAYDYYTIELWKSGDDYLREMRYCLEDGTLLLRRGYMLRDGVGYSLDWVGDTVTTEVSFWERTDYLVPDTFTLWEAFLTLYDSSVGQVYVQDDALRFYDYSDFISDTGMSDYRREELDRTYPVWNHDYSELAYFFDEAGAIEEITHTLMLSLDPETADPFVDCKVEIFDTTPEEIAEIIRMQDVTGTYEFSWEEDRERYADVALFTGFVNQNPAMTIRNAEDAIRLAEGEAIPEEHPRYRSGDIYNMKNVWYDPETATWKVRLYFSQDSDFQLLVWMDEHGITRMKSYESEEFH